MSEEPEYRYRIWGVLFDELDPVLFEDAEAKDTVLVDRLRVIKKTPTGVWLPGKKWTSDRTHKRFAYPTIEEALESFKRRRIKYVARLKHQLQQAEKELAWVSDDEEALTQTREALRLKECKGEWG